MIIEFEGKVVEKKNGYFKCPYKCGQSGYPQPKWKTENGFRGHMEKCSKKPSAVLKRKENKEAEEKACVENRKLKDDVFSTITHEHKKGDKLYAVGYSVTKPTHVWRGERRVMVRYEEKRSYWVDEFVVKRISYKCDSWFDGDKRVLEASTYYNNYNVSNVFKTREEAEECKKANEKSYNEHCKFSSFCR